jgi:hypothetical protein
MSVFHRNGRSKRSIEVVQGQEIRPCAVDNADARADPDVSGGANEFGADWTHWSIDNFPIGKVGLN